MLNATLQAAPSVNVAFTNPGVTHYELKTTYAELQQQGCILDGQLQLGFCGNWWASYANTGQPLFPSEACVRDVRGGATMPWCRCMVGGGDC